MPFDEFSVNINMPEVSIDNQKEPRHLIDIEIRDQKSVNSEVFLHMNILLKFEVKIDDLQVSYNNMKKNQTMKFEICVPTERTYSDNGAVEDTYKWYGNSSSIRFTEKEILICVNLTRQIYDSNTTGEWLFKNNAAFHLYLTVKEMKCETVDAIWTFVCRSIKGETIWVENCQFLFTREKKSHGCRIVGKFLELEASGDIIIYVILKKFQPKSSPRKP